MNPWAGAGTAVWGSHASGSGTRARLPLRAIQRRCLTMSSDPNSHLPPSLATESPLAGVVTFLKTLRKHWAVVVACVVLSCGAALIYTKSVRRVYEGIVAHRDEPACAAAIRRGLRPDGVRHERVFR